MKTLSQDLRKRVVDAVNTGRTKIEVATTFQVSYSSVKRWVNQANTTGHLIPKARPGRTRRIKAEQHHALEQLWRLNPDATLVHYCQAWANQQGCAVPSEATMSRMLRRLGWSRKKRVWSPPNATKPTEPSLELTRPT